MNSDFDCPMKPGVMCRSLDQVNTMVDRGEVGKGDVVSCDARNCVRNKPASTTDFTTPFPNTLKSGEPLRYGENVVRVWIAPFEDAVGNYHQESVVYTVIKPGRWIGNPPQGYLGFFV